MLKPSQFQGSICQLTDVIDIAHKVVKVFWIMFLADHIQIWILVLILGAEGLLLYSHRIFSGLIRIRMLNKILLADIILLVLLLRQPFQIEE